VRGRIRPEERTRRQGDKEMGRWGDGVYPGAREALCRFHGGHTACARHRRSDALQGERTRGGPRLGCRRMLSASALTLRAAAQAISFHSVPRQVRDEGGPRHERRGGRRIRRAGRTGLSEENGGLAPERGGRQDGAPPKKAQPLSTSAPASTHFALCTLHFSFSSSLAEAA